MRCRSRFSGCRCSSACLGTNALVRLDQMLQHSGLLYSPSVFLRTVAKGYSVNNLDKKTLLVCPESGGALEREGDTLYCRSSGLSWAIRDGIYDFKSPLD